MKADGEKVTRPGRLLVLSPISHPIAPIITPTRQRGTGSRRSNLASYHQRDTQSPPSSPSLCLGWNGRLPGGAVRFQRRVGISRVKIIE
uniref:Uncharacterized protein n=1 Tax=Setaria italica TaxID=4555 RepID=K3XNR5_SETIT